MIRDMSGRLSYTAGIRALGGANIAAVEEKRECREPPTGMAEGEAEPHLLNVRQFRS